ncbi:MAG: type IV secretion system DNA-binding domain-containing protein [Candidatus Berkelbacteria bacterium]|nr:type IV secretion system DNA-binding domain-containing protein [Candidatus Berkelbacteria bacterium]
MESVLCRLMVPKNNEKSPASAELFFAALHGVFDYQSKIQPIMSFEIVSINKFIQFYFYVPRYLKEFVEGQFYAQYPNVEINEAEDYAAKDIGDKHALGIEMGLTRSDVYPIKTFQSFDVDPLSGITSILSQLGEGDELWIQICISPVDDTWQKKAISYVNAIKSGRDPNEPVWKSITKGLFGIVGNVAKSPEAQATEVNKNVEVSGPVSTALTGIETKTMKLGFKTKMRVISLSNDPSKASQRLNSTVGAFKQFNTSNMNGFVHGKVVSGAPIVDVYRSRNIGVKPVIFNIEELASIYHLPTLSVETPTMDYAGSKKGEPPQNLPLKGSVSENEISIIGKSNFRGEERVFGIKENDRALHIYAIGKTGTGKSTLLKHMIIDDIMKGKGVAVVDPHGDLIADVLEYIPKERTDDVIFFSPADREFPVGFNLFEKVDPEYKNIVASGIVGVFKKIFGESWGPRLEYILRNVVLGLLDYPGATLLSVLKVLTDTKFRRGVIEKISDPVIKDFFLNEYEKYDQKFRTEAVAPIQNKVGQFLSSTVIRNIVGQENSTIDIRGTMDNSKILLIDLSIGKIGEDNSALLGSLMITKIQMAAMSRADLPRDKRTPFYLYVDEFQNFATDSFAVVLSEARKYGLSLMVTNQYIAQMPETVANAVFGNVGTLVTFRVGAGDAEFLNREFVPVFEPADLTNLNNYCIYLKMAIDGVTSTPFSAKTILTEYEPTGNTEEVISLSRKKYAKPRLEIEQAISDKTINSSPTEIISNLNSSPTPASATTSIDLGSRNILDENNNNNNNGNKDDESNQNNLPEELQNVKKLEDYETKNWYFLTRTGYKKAIGEEVENNEEEKDDKSEDKITKQDLASDNMSNKEKEPKQKSQTETEASNQTDEAVKDNAPNIKVPKPLIDIKENAAQEIPPIEQM